MTTMETGVALGIGTILPRLVVTFTRETLVRYAGAGGDFNPIHYSSHAATELGLPDVVAHGMLTMGTALRVVTEWADPEAVVQSYSARFTRPMVVPDDGVGSVLEVTGVVSDLSDDVLTINVEAFCRGEKVLGAGRVVIDLGRPA